MILNHSVIIYIYIFLIYFVNLFIYFVNLLYIFLVHYMYHVCEASCMCLLRNISCCFDRRQFNLPWCAAAAAAAAGLAGPLIYCPL